MLIDEAHSSQTSTAATKIRQILSLEEAAQLDAREDRQPDAEDEIARRLAAMGQREHISFLAFTATPKKRLAETLPHEQTALAGDFSKAMKTTRRER